MASKSSCKTLCHQCNNDHNENKVTMAEIRQQLHHLTTSQTELTQIVKDHIKHSEEILAKKADKEDVEKLKDKIVSGLVWASITLLGIVITLVVYIWQKSHP
jgi:C4-type Zn-finger protein